MEKANLDWANIGFGYMKTDKRYVSNYKNGSWDEGEGIKVKAYVPKAVAGQLGLL